MKAFANYGLPVRPQLALLPSPLLGSAAWEPVAELLRRAGWPVQISTAPDRPQTPDEVMGSFLGSLPDDRPVVLIPHSNAGLYVPGLIRGRTVVATVFVDAALPSTDGPIPLAPTGMHDFLEMQADEHGILAPWTQWWDESDLADLFHSRAMRDRVEAGQPRVPLAYFHSSLPAAPGWDDTTAAYLAFGDTYATTRQQAAERNWPIKTLPGRHLHMLIEPAQVADAVTELLASLSVRTDH